MASPPLEADTAKNLGALEAQLLALSNTKNDMRTLRTHIAGLEEALEELNTANDGLRRELGRKSELNEQQRKRIQQQQERLIDLENAASEARELRQKLAEARAEAEVERERAEAAEQQLSAVGRSHELLHVTLTGTCERLLHPHGPYDSTAPLAWQQQLHDELVAVASAQLTTQATQLLRAAHRSTASSYATAAGVSSTPLTAVSTRGPTVSRHAARNAFATGADGAASAPRDAGTLPLAEGGGVAAWWLSTAGELRVERGQLLAQVEQRRREQRAERAILTEAIEDAERLLPTALLALREKLSLDLAEARALPAAARREVLAAREALAREAEGVVARVDSEVRSALHACAHHGAICAACMCSPRRDRPCAACICSPRRALPCAACMCSPRRALPSPQVRALRAATTAQLERSSLRQHALQQQLSAAHERLRLIETTSTDAARAYEERSREAAEAFAMSTQAQRARMHRAIEGLGERLAGRRNHGLLRRVVLGWHECAHRSVLQRRALGGTSRRSRTRDCRAAWTALHEWVYYARRARRAVRRLLHQRAARALRVWVYVLDERQVRLQPLMTLMASDGI
jgi:hypothetical protein